MVFLRLLAPDFSHGLSICDERWRARLSLPDMEQPVLRSRAPRPGLPALLPIALN